MKAVDEHVATADDRQRAKRHLDDHEKNDERRRPRQLGAVLMAQPHINRRAQDHGRHDEHAGAGKEGAHGPFDPLRGHASRHAPV